MYEFLNREVLNNLVGQYILVAAIILFVFLVKKYIAHYIAQIIFRFVKIQWKTIDIKTFRELVTKPLGLFLAILVTVVALDKLTFPEILDFNLYRISLKELIRMVTNAVLIITFFRFVTKCIDFIVLILKDHYIQSGDTANAQPIFFFKDFIKVLAGLMAIILVLKYSFGYDVKGLVTGLSIVGAAIALALKENLENLIASFIIFFDKPFAPGDVVKTNAVSGTIEKIGLRSTRIRSDAKTYITVPNKQMADTILDNLSVRTQRRADLSLSISVSTPPNKVQSLIEGIKKTLERDEIVDSSALFSDIPASAFVINCTYYIKPIPMAEFHKSKTQINLEILNILEQTEIEISGKSSDINIIKVKDGE